jgi:hypothetical protein
VPYRFESRLREIPGQLKKVPGLIKFAVDYTTDPKQMSVVPSLIVFYVMCVWDGWYNAFVAVVPTQVLEESLTPLQYGVFVYITLISPCLTLTGMCLRGRLAWTGALMMLWGNVGVAGVLWTFITAVFYTQWWGQGNFATTWVIASALGSIVFVIRDIRRLLDNDRWEDHG